MRGNYDSPPDPVAYQARQPEPAPGPPSPVDGWYPPYPPRYYDPIGEERSEGLRRLSKLTWRATQLSAVAAVGFAALFAHTAHSYAANKAATLKHTAKPTASPSPSPTPTKTKKKHHHHHHAAAAAASPASGASAPSAAASAPAPAPAPPTTAPAPPPSSAPPPTSSGGSSGGG